VALQHERVKKAGFTEQIALLRMLSGVLQTES